MVASATKQEGVDYNDEDYNDGGDWSGSSDGGATMCVAI
jgi:hypothetical protein